MAYHFTRHATDSGLDSYLKTVHSWVNGETLDYTDFAAYDPNSVLTVAEHQIDVTSAQGQGLYHVTKDYGEGYFAGNFEYAVQAKIIYESYRCGAFWALSNVADDITAIRAAGGHVVFVAFGSEGRISLNEMYSTQHYTQFLTIADNTDYYMVVERDESIGDNGTLFLRIFSDSSRTVLLKECYLALHARTAFRFLHAANSWRQAGVSGTYSSVIKNLSTGTSYGKPVRVHIPTEWSLFFRFRAEDITNNHHILNIEMDDSYGNRHTFYANGAATGDPVQWAMYKDNQASTLSTSTSYSANTWHSIIACRSASSGRYISLDGGPFVQNTGVKYPYGSALYMTVSSSGTRRAIAGDVAEIAIWNVDLSLPEYAADVAALAQGINPMTIRPADLVHYWDLTRGLQDHIGGCTLTPFNSPTISEHPRVIP